MPHVTPSPIPEGALLRAYERDGVYADCFTTDVPGAVTHARFVEAFYSTGVFALERFILKWAVKKPSTLDDTRRLAHGQTDAFAAWTVEGRAPDQLLLCDFMGRTRSWLMVAPVAGGTRLFFGSAVVPQRDPRTGHESMGGAFSALLGFHKLYSRVLLSAARRRLTRQGETT